MQPGDWPAVAAIYAEGIATGDATFETVVPGFDAWDAAHLPHPRLVARTDAAVVGWAALSAVSRREVYRGVAEDTIYVAERGPRTGRRRSAPARAGRRGGARRHLDAAGRHLPRERRKHRAARALWLPDRRDARAPGQPARGVARRRPDGATQRGARVSPVIGIDHVQVAAPPGCEDAGARVLRRPARPARDREARACSQRAAAAGSRAVRSSSTWASASRSRRDEGPPGAAPARREALEGLLAGSARPGCRRGATSSCPGSRAASWTTRSATASSSSRPRRRSERRASRGSTRVGCSVSSARCRILPTPRASSPAPRSTSATIRPTPTSACATRSPRASRPPSAPSAWPSSRRCSWPSTSARARRAAGHGRLGQGRHRQALPRRAQSDERARRGLQGAELDRARPRLPLAHPPGAPAARRDRHLQPLALRGRARRAGRGARAEAGLEEALRGHQRVRAAPRERGHDRRQALPAHLRGGAGRSASASASPTARRTGSSRPTTSPSARSGTTT